MIKKMTAKVLKTGLTQLKHSAGIASEPKIPKILK